MPYTYMKENLLIIVNPQNDYMDTGCIPVLGSLGAIKELSSWIRVEALKITDILIFQNSHGPCDISLPSAWEDKSGKILDPLTTITKKSVENGSYSPRFITKDQALDYLEKISTTLVLKPRHCIDGSEGAAIPEELSKALQVWSEKNKGKHWIVRKTKQGLLQEFISPFSDTTGKLDENLLSSVLSFDKIYLSGFPKDTCISETIKDFDRVDKANQLILLDFGMAALNKKANSLDIIKDIVEKKGMKILEKR